MTTLPSITHTSPEAARVDALGELLRRCSRFIGIVEQPIELYVPATPGRHTRVRRDTSCRIPSCRPTTCAPNLRSRSSSPAGTHLVGALAVASTVPKRSMTRRREAPNILRSTTDITAEHPCLGRQPLDISVAPIGERQKLVPEFLRNDEHSPRAVNDATPPKLKRAATSEQNRFRLHGRSTRNPGRESDDALDR